MYYTIGQRHGLGIGGPGEAWFVFGKDTVNNRLLVSQGFDHESLYSTSCLISGTNWVSGTFPQHTDITAKFRYRQPDQHVRIEDVGNGDVRVHFQQPIRAVTPGQSAVFYDGDVCLGGGTIEKLYVNQAEKIVVG
jgi:tRNA-specific 2-thiouridylase